MEKILGHFRSYQTAPDLKHLDVLDGVRALCVLLVAWFHIWQQSWLTPYWTVMEGQGFLTDLLLRLGLVTAGETFSLDFLLRSGYLWVDGMILLSGFLLYLPYTQAGTKLPAVGAFYKRRLIRILPSYLLCVIPMFILACVRGQYGSALDAAKDLVAHLTFTFNLFRTTYFYSPINGALWTIAVEMQFYLLFPLLARAYRKAPLVTYFVMAGIAVGFRFYGSAQADTSMYFNQMPAFLDVYANGFLAASVYAALSKRLGQKPETKVKVFFSVVMALCVCLLIQIAQAQAYAPDIQRGQMARRFPLSAVLGCFMVCAGFSIPLIRFLLGNAVMRFMASISLQFYIYHQLLAVKIKEWGLIPSESATPWMSSEYRWQLLYTLTCFLLALILATLITYLFERPIARTLRRKLDAEK